MIISIGFRVNSKTAIKYRTWKNKIIKEYMVKGFVLMMIDLLMVIDLKQDILMNY